MSNNNQSKNYNLNPNSTPLIMKYASRKLPKNRRSQLNTHKNENTFMNDRHTNDILVRNAFVLKKPMVLLQKLSDIIKSSSLSSSMISICVNDQFRNSNINVHPKVFDTIFNHSQKSLKLNDERKTTSRKKSKEILFQEKSPRDKIITMHECGNANAVSFSPFLSSTPKDKETLRNAKKKNDTRRTSYNELNKSQKNITLTVEENEQKVKKQDTTYELIEPKTPNLQKRMHKERNAKKENFYQRVTRNSKIRFTNRLSDIKNNSPLRTSNSEKKQINNFATNTPKNSSRKNILRSPTRMRSNSIRDSVPSTTKEVPNFAKIHKKMFAKSESIVDAKKRIIDRHTKITASKKKYNSEKERLNSQGENQLARRKKSNENSSSRLEPRIRKREAIEHILKNKNNTSHLTKSKEENRAILKGVRTNRRFELQMKFRNRKL